MNWGKQKLKHSFKVELDCVLCDSKIIPGQNYFEDDKGITAHVYCPPKELLKRKR